MPTYVFKCRRCDSVFEQYRPLANFSRQALCDCDGLSDLVVTPTVQASVFTPYVERNMTREPIRIESKQQRDALCEQHGVTYDSAKYVRRQPPPAAVDTMSEAEIKTVIEQSRIPGDKNK